MGDKEKGLFSSFYPEKKDDKKKEEKKYVAPFAKTENKKKEDVKKYETKENSRRMDEVVIAKPTKEPKQDEVVTSPEGTPETVVAVDEAKVLESKAVKGDVGPIYRKSHINLIEQKPRGVGKYFR